jgi:hypothetical protein
VHLLNERSLAIVRTAYELSEEKQTPNVADIQEHFGNRLRLDECRASECAYRVVVSNQILAALRIVPYTEMESHFWTRDGVVLNNMVDYTTTVNRHYRIVSHVQIDFCKGCQTFAIDPWGATSPLDTNGIVEIGNKASAESRRTVLSLNTGCLTKLGGCQSVADLLPAVWKQTTDNRIACVIQNDRGFVQKPANWQ